MAGGFVESFLASERGRTDVRNSRTNEFNAQTSRTQVENARTAQIQSTLSDLTEKTRKQIQATYDAYQQQIDGNIQLGNKEAAATLEADRKKAIFGLSQRIGSAAQKASQNIEGVDIPGIITAVQPVPTSPAQFTQAVEASGKGQIKGAETRAVADVSREVPNVENYTTGDGKIVAVDLNAPDAQATVAQILSEGGSKAPTRSTQSITTSTAPTSKVTGALQTDVISNQNRIGRLQSIKSQIEDNPEFLTLFGKLSAKALDRIDFLGIPIGDGGEEFLVKQSQFVRDSIENINAYIKEITGAQMSEREATRLRLAQPDPGEDVFSGQGPTKFKALAERAIEAARLAQARSMYFLENGINYNFADSAGEPPVSLDEMKNIMNQKGREQAAIIRANNPDMPRDEVIRRAKQNVQQRFGISQ